MAKAKQPTIRHEPSDECYIDEFRRRCPRCGEEKELFHFRPDDDTPRPMNDITPFCNICRASIQQQACEHDRELKRTAALSKSADAVNQLGRMLNNVGKRRILEEACPSLVDGVRHMMDAFGGEQNFWSLASQAIKESMESPRADIRIKAVNTAIGFVRDGNKMQGDPVDFEAFGEEELVLLLRPSAKALLLENAEFRRELLNDPDVRQMFQSDLGIEVFVAEEQP